MRDTHIWSNYSDLTRPHPKWWFSKGNPLISGKSRLVKYNNLARHMALHTIWGFCCSFFVWDPFMARIFVTFSWLEVCRCSQRFGCHLQGTFRDIHVPLRQFCTDPAVPKPRCPQVDGHRSCSTWVGAKSLVVQVRFY